jgi:hypothetical protein
MRKAFDYKVNEHEWSETGAPIASNSTIKEIISGDIVTNALDAEGFLVNTPGYYNTLTDASDGNSIHYVELSHPDATIGSGGLIIYPIDPARKIYLVYITKTEISSSGNRTLIRSVTSTEPYIDLNPSMPDPLAAGGTSFAERRAKFKGCMAAAWNDLTSDVIHAVGCNSIFVNACVAACVATCAHHLAGSVGTGPCASIATTEDMLSCLCDLHVLICDPGASIATTDGYYFPTY